MTQVSVAELRRLAESGATKTEMRRFVELSERQIEYRLESFGIQAGRKRPPHAWPPEDEKKLIDLRAAGHSYSYIAGAIGRSEAAVREKRHSMALQSQKTAIYTPDELDTLRRMMISGRTFREIGVALNRSKDAVKNKAVTLARKDKSFAGIRDQHAVDMARARMGRPPRKSNAES